MFAAQTIAAAAKQMLAARTRMGARDKMSKINMSGDVNIDADKTMTRDAKIVYNKLLGGWYIVRGNHQTPISGRFESKEAAMNWLLSRRTARQ